MANARKHLRFIATAGRGRKMAAWATDETVSGDFEAPVAADAMLVTAAFDANQNPETIEDDQRRSGSRSRRAAFSGHTPHGTGSLACHMRGVGITGAWTTSNVPQGHKTIKNLLGSARLVNTHTADDILTIVSHTAAQTVITVADASLYTVGDTIRVKSNNAATAYNPKKGTGLGGECSKITALDVGTDQITLKPGLSMRPILTGTPDQIQGGWSYLLTEDWGGEITQSYLLQDSDILGKMLFGAVAEQSAIDFNPTDLLRVVHSIGYLGELIVGAGQVRGDATTDAFLSTDSILRVSDARAFPVGSLVNLKHVTPSTDAVVGTEVKATVTASDSATNQITLNPRGSTPVAATDLTAVTSTQEVEGPYDTDIAGVPAVLRINIDNRGDLDITMPGTAADTSASVVTAINDALKADSRYGVFMGPGHPGTAVTWEAAASSVATAKVRLTSQVWGSQSRIQVKDTGLATSAHDIIFSAAFDLLATDEVQIQMWTPGITEVAGASVHNKVGWGRIDGYKMAFTEFTIAPSNNPEWLEGSKNDTGLPDGVVDGDSRSIDISIGGRFTGDTPWFFHARDNETTHDLIIQTSRTEGDTWAIGAERFKFIGDISISGDNVKTFTATIRVEASVLNEDELRVAQI